MDRATLCLGYSTPPDARRLKIDAAVLATHSLLCQSRLARSSGQPCKTIRLTTRFLAKSYRDPKELVSIRCIFVNFCSQEKEIFFFKSTFFLFFVSVSFFLSFFFFVKLEHRLFFVFSPSLLFLSFFNFTLFFLLLLLASLFQSFLSWILS